MPYGDEEIIRRRVAAGAKQKHTIKNEVEIDGVKYTFARREFEFGFSMVVPEQFEMLSTEYAKRKYPYEDRPKIIIASENTETCLAFNCGDLSGESLEDRIQIYRSCIKRLHPSNVFFTKGIYNTISDIKIAYYDYRYLVLDGDTYNLSFVTDLQDSELFCWFTCSLDLRKKWESLIREMIHTIQVSDIGGGTNAE